MNIEDMTEHEKTIDMAIRGGRAIALQGVSDFLEQKMAGLLSSNWSGPEFVAYSMVLHEVDRMLSIENIYGEH